MKKSFIQMGLLTLISCLVLVGCNSFSDGSYSMFSPSGSNYNRSQVCQNLTRQIEFNNDQGYSTTNVGQGQVQQQQLLSAYKANGCDK